MRELVDDLLDLSRLEERSVRLERSSVAPRLIVEGAAAAARTDVAEAGARVSLDIADALPEVSADADHLQRALANLIQNAVRHAGDGGARVVVSADELPDFVQFSVADDGPGLAIADQQRVFEPFVGGEGPHGRAGLGLRACRSPACPAG